MNKIKIKSLFFFSFYYILSILFYSTFLRKTGDLFLYNLLFLILFAILLFLMPSISSSYPNFIDIGILYSFITFTSVALTKQDWKITSFLLTIGGVFVFILYALTLRFFKIDIDKLLYVKSPLLVLFVLVLSFLTSFQVDSLSLRINFVPALAIGCLLGVFGYEFLARKLSPSYRWMGWVFVFIVLWLSIISINYYIFDPLYNTLSFNQDGGTIAIIMGLSSFGFFIIKLLSYEYDSLQNYR